MAIVQEAFFIPDDILKKVLTGEFRRFGGVVLSHYTTCLVARKNSLHTTPQK